MCWMTFSWPWQTKFACLQDKVRTTQPITTKHGSYIPLVMLTTWLDFGGILVKTLFFAKLSLKISDVSFQGQTLYWTYLRNGWSDWYETKRRCIGWILGELCDLDIWPHSWPWPCSFKVKVWNSLIWGMRRLIDMDRKGCESIIHDHDCDLWVTMVGWVDAPYSDWGDFRRWRAVDISSFNRAMLVVNIPATLSTRRAYYDANVEHDVVCSPLEYELNMYRWPLWKFILFLILTYNNKKIYIN